MGRFSYHGYRRFGRGGVFVLLIFNNLGKVFSCLFGRNLFRFRAKHNLRSTWSFTHGHFSRGLISRRCFRGEVSGGGSSFKVAVRNGRSSSFKVAVRNGRSRNMGPSVCMLVSRADGCLGNRSRSRRRRGDRNRYAPRRKSRRHGAGGGPSGIERWGRRAWTMTRADVDLSRFHRFGCRDFFRRGRWNFCRRRVSFLYESC